MRRTAPEVEAEVVRLYQDGWTLRDIAAKGLVCGDTGTRILRDHGLVGDPQRRSRWTPDLKHCPKGHERPKSASRCRECRREYSQQYHRVRRYGVDKDQFEVLLRKQAGRCGLCRKEPDGVAADRFRVDHDHETGQVRGILCHPCNVALGGLGDSVSGLKRALAYLEGRSEWATN